MRRLFFATALLSACASSTGLSERSFVRPEMEALPLSSLEVVVVAAGPPRLAKETFSVGGFGPPGFETPLLGGEEDPQSRDELLKSITRELDKRGYKARFWAAGRPDAATSSRAISGPEVLTASTTLARIAARSSADALLVLRAVPVDALTLDEGRGTRMEVTAMGREQVRDHRPVRVSGRVYVGQAFLFDRATGLRLWSRQAPSYPDDGRLGTDHPFLRFGVVFRDGEPRPADWRQTAADRFVGGILDAFPLAKAGDPESRRSLLGIDAHHEATRQAFLDEGHWLLDVSAGYGFESAKLELAFYDSEAPALGPGAIAPSGLFRLVPRVGYLLVGGTLLSLGIPLTLGPGSFGRTYFADNPDPSLANPEDRAVHVQLSGLMAAGLEAQLGIPIELVPGLALVPRGGLFGDYWSIGGGPSEVATGRHRLRAGLLLGTDLWLNQNAGVLGRLGVDAKVGVDFTGAVVLGLALSTGFGLLL